MVDLLHLYISPGHNFLGHYGQPPGSHPILECASVECVAGHGLRGDRYFNHKDNYKGQVTFFAHEVYAELVRASGMTVHPPAVFRRNIITRGLDLNAMIGRQFQIGGVQFEGTEECRPCAWMDQAFASGTEFWLRGRGGLRARILNNGVLCHSVGVEMDVLDDVLA